jgi:hypothetical protein
VIPFEPTPEGFFDDLLATLREAKPNDRSEQDRYFAIVITDVEKARAVFLTYCAKENDE